MLESSFLASRRELIAIVRERVNGELPLPGSADERSSRGTEPVFCQDDELGALAARQARWPLDYQMIRVDPVRRTVTFSAGYGGNAPLFVRGDAAEVSFSWDPQDLLSQVTSADLSPDFFALQILGCEPYGAQTAYRPVKMLTERSEITVTPNGVSVRYPPPGPYYPPITVRGDGDVPAAYIALLSQVLTQRPLAETGLVAEVSGGLDSAVVALVAAGALPKPLRTYALMVEGPAQDQQRRRREVLVDLAGAADSTLAVGEVTAIPYDLSSPLGYRAFTFNNDYQRAFGRLFLKAGVTAGTSVASGTGGDELQLKHHVEQSEAERRAKYAESVAPRVVPSYVPAAVANRIDDVAENIDRAPFPVVPTSVLKGIAARAPLFLERGAWLVNPMADPDVIAWCSSLPLQWRTRKRLHRETLAALNVPDHFFHAPLHENFLWYLYRCMLEARDPVISAMTCQSALADMGILDVPAFARFVQDASGADDFERITAFYNVYNAEAMARQV